MTKNLVAGLVLAALMIMGLLAFAQKHEGCLHGRSLNTFKPCGSASTPKRPIPSIVIGSIQNRAPNCLAFAALASHSATAKYASQCGGICTLRGFVGGIPYQNKTNGLTYGVQAETWW